MIHTALEGTSPIIVGGMPAHLTKADLELGTATESDGSLVTSTDVWANDVADKLAKLGAEYHRVPAEEAKRWKAAHNATKARAKWIGTVTHAANNLPDFPFPRFGSRAVEGDRGTEVPCREESGHRRQKKERSQAGKASYSCEQRRPPH